MISLFELQVWTSEQFQETNIPTVCHWCETDMIPGYAIDPHWEESCCSRPRLGSRHPNLTAENVEFIFVLKCPKCGNNEQVPQEIFQKGSPPGFDTWRTYWGSRNAVI